MAPPLRKVLHSTNIHQYILAPLLHHCFHKQYQRYQQLTLQRNIRWNTDLTFPVSTLSFASIHGQELLKSKEEDFKYANAANRREVHQLEEKCAELQRVIASSDVVGKFRCCSQKPAPNSLCPSKIMVVTPVRRTEL